MNKDYKSGFVTLIGRPNVGKSTLMNYLIGQKIACLLYTSGHSFCQRNGSGACSCRAVHFGAS